MIATWGLCLRGTQSIVSKGDFFSSLEKVVIFLSICYNYNRSIKTNLSTTIIIKLKIALHAIRKNNAT